MIASAIVLLCLGQTAVVRGNSVLFTGCAWEWSVPDRPAPAPVWIYADEVLAGSCGNGPDWISPDSTQAWSVYAGSARHHRWMGAWERKVFPAGARWTITYGGDPRCPPGVQLVLMLDLTCPADLNHDGAVTSDDLAEFLAGYEEGWADLDDGSGAGRPDGGVDINDLLYFLARYEAGC